MQKKSQGVSFILTLLFGPLGILYTSVSTALGMLVLYVAVMTMVIATGDFVVGFLIAVAATVIAGAFSVTSYNENAENEEKKQKEMQEEMIKKAIEENKQKEFIQRQMIEEAVQARMKELEKEKKLES